ncbi:hypothetical protein cce_2497 [Crocosphaera subtropica ATCC 51142]|uniref:Tyr recombinase domain-containing protein n=2 Tax=Crocosphaera TaxID=263510 RepID=B1WRJ6_CROS5|nr:hypothetical protein cce_2497 [Crocosphaera subtropica ATCC 51142]
MHSRQFLLRYKYINNIFIFSLHSHPFIMLNTLLTPHLWKPKISLLEEFLQVLPLQYRTIVALAYFTTSRVEDILSLQKQDITSEMIIIEDSTLRKTKQVPIITKLRPYLTVYLNGYETQSSDFLFSDKLGKPLKTSQVFKILKMVANKINLPDMYLSVLR